MANALDSLPLLRRNVPDHPSPRAQLVDITNRFLLVYQDVFCKLLSPLRKQFAFSSEFSLISRYDPALPCC